MQHLPHLIEWTVEGGAPAARCSVCDAHGVAPAAIACTTAWYR